MLTFLTSLLSKEERFRCKYDIMMMSSVVMCTMFREEWFRCIGDIMVMSSFLVLLVHDGQEAEVPL